MVLEVDEAGILEPVEDGLGSLFALVRRSVVEFGKVDKLERVVTWSAKR